ncbi:hypothetical protein IAU60_006007 [Kwoniella sp. DSM 27419]
MVYDPHRRHAVASLGTLTQAVSLLQHFYTPNLLILISRIMAQLQINACVLIHPTKSLLSLTAMLSVMNLAAVLLHLLDFAAGSNGGKGLILDFIGQANPACLSRVLLLDLLLYIIQMVALCVSYVTHSPTLPKSSFFKYDDLLLPPACHALNEADLIEAGGKASGGLSTQSGATYAPLASSEAERELWLDDEEAVGSTNTLRIREPPLIFSLSLKHVLDLILRLPAPLPPPRAFSGGTPLNTPPLTPAIGPTRIVPPVDNVPANGAEVRSGSLGLSGAEDTVGRIPGEYRGVRTGSDW